MKKYIKKYLQKTEAWQEYATEAKVINPSSSLQDVLTDRTYLYSLKMCARLRELGF